MLKGYKIVYTASNYTMNEKTLEKKYFNSQKTEIVIFLPAESLASARWMTWQRICSIVELSVLKKQRINFFWVIA